METNHNVSIKFSKKSKSDDVPESFVCEDCSAVCKNARNLNRHKRELHGDKEYTCQDCGELVVGQRAFLNHRRKHKPKVNCPKCNKLYVERSLSTHVAKCAPKQQQPVKVKTHDCDKCSSSFYSGDALAGHKRTTHDRPKTEHSYECHWCTYSSNKVSNRARHERHCPARRRLQAPGNGVFSKVDLLSLFTETHMSITDMAKVVKIFRDHFGSEWFEAGIGKTVTDEIENMKNYTQASRIKITNSDGEPDHRVISHIRDLDQFIKDMVKARNISRPRVTVAADSGQQKFLVIMNLYDLDDLDRLYGGVKASAPQASFLLSVCDDVPENYENVSTIFKATGFPITLEDIDIRSVPFLYILLSFLSLLHDYILISPILSLYICWRS